MKMEWEGQQYPKGKGRKTDDLGASIRCLYAYVHTFFLLWIILYKSIYIYERDCVGYLYTFYCISKLLTTSMENENSLTKMRGSKRSAKQTPCMDGWLLDGEIVVWLVAWMEWVSSSSVGLFCCFLCGRRNSLFFFVQKDRQQNYFVILCGIFKLILTKLNWLPLCWSKSIYENEIVWVCEQ